MMDNRFFIKELLEHINVSGKISDDVCNSFNLWVNTMQEKEGQIT